MNIAILTAGLITAVISALNLIFPEFFIRFGNVWKFEGDVEPTSDAIYITRFFAVICLIFGVIMAVYGGFFDWINAFLGLNL